MSEAGNRYAELMAPAWENGLADVSDIIAMDAPPIVKWATCQQRVKDELERVDWDSTGLPVGPPEDETQIGERMPKNPRSQAERFLSFNFDDTLKIMKLVVESANDNGIAIDTTFANLIKGSKRNLLLPSRLADYDKSTLFRAIEYSEVKEVVAGLGGPIFEGGPIVYSSDLGMFDWRGEIKQWIKERLDPEHGCPANSILTSTEPRVPLTYFFWDRLAEAMFEKPQVG